MTPKFFNKSHNKYFVFDRKFSLGFTLVELMIVIAIVTSLMSVVVYNYVSFNDRLALRSASESIILKLREVQSYSVSAKETTISYASGPEKSFNTPLGLAFRWSPSSNKEYYVFADTNNDSYANIGLCVPGSECLETVPLPDNVYISCVGALGHCPSAPVLQDLVLLFKRPSTDIKITTSLAIPPTFPIGVVQLSSRTTTSTLYIFVTDTGQVYVAH